MNIHDEIDRVTRNLENRVSNDVTEFEKLSEDLENCANWLTLGSPDPEENEIMQHWASQLRKIVLPKPLM